MGVIILICIFVSGIYAIISGIHSGTTAHVIIGAILALIALVPVLIGLKKGSPETTTSDNDSNKPEKVVANTENSKVKTSPSETINFHLITDGMQSNIENLKTKKNPAYNVSQKEFIESEAEGVSVYEYYFESKEPEIIDRGDCIVALVSGTEVGILKPGSVSRVRNLIKAGRIEGISVSLYGGKRKKYRTWLNHAGEDILDFLCDEKDYSADLCLHITPKSVTAPTTTSASPSNLQKNQYENVDELLSIVPHFSISSDGEKINKRDRFTDDIVHSRITVRSDIEKLGSYVALDIETTGLSMTCDIIEIGAVRFEQFNPVAQFSILTKPNRQISAKITTLTGITNDMLVDSPHFYEILPSLYEFVGSSNIVAHNVNFDIPRLIVNGLNLLKERRKFYDTLDLAKKCLQKGTDVDDYKLETLLGYYHIHTLEHHRATSDAAATGILFATMVHQILKKE